MKTAENKSDGFYIVETKELSKHFGAVKAVDRLTMSLPKEGMTSIVGPNGSGKSTLINLLSGTLPFDEGIVIIDGASCRFIKPYESPTHGLTRTFQEIRLFDQMTVWDNILVILTSRGVFSSLVERPNVKYKDKAREIIDAVGLWEKRKALAMNLSYGQRKLLEVGRALAMDVKIFLFDEPFAGLFPKMLEKVKTLLKELKRRGCTVVFVSHNMDIIRELSDHIFVLDNGALLAEGEVDEVLNRPEVIEAYLGT
ncbi:MAG: ATP-binding cassette domain-containing protein [Dehalococcoidia bacterium]